MSRPIQRVWAGSSTLFEIARGRASAPNPRARAGGAKARQSGRDFQTALDLVHAWYHRQRIAAVQRLHEPTEGHGPTLRRTGFSDVDYLGTVALPVGPPGALVGVAFDAKVITGDATFKAPHASEGEGRARPRFFAQVAYLRELRDRFRYRAGFLLADPGLGCVWWVGPAHLDALAAGDAVPVRTLPRPTKADPRPAPVHHLPVLAGLTLHTAHVPALASRRPPLDYLRLVLPEGTP